LNKVDGPLSKLLPPVIRVCYTQHELPDNEKIKFATNNDTGWGQVSFPVYFTTGPLFFFSSQRRVECKPTIQAMGRFPFFHRLLFEPPLFSPFSRAWVAFSPQIFSFVLFLVLAAPLAWVPTALLDPSQPSFFSPPPTLDFLNALRCFCN